MRNVAGDEQLAVLKERIVVNDPAAIRSAAVLGLGVAMIAKPDALPYLENGELIRLIPAWYADAGPISIYYASRTFLPTKTRVFIDFIGEVFQRQRWPERFAGTLG
jgi:DNA-binding transcriptional LysR family regulator